MRDLQYAIRMLRRNPGFALVAVATLGLGIGLNTALFSVTHAALVRPLAYPGAERLVWLTDYDYRIENRDNYVSRPAYLQWKAEARSFDAMTAYGNQDLAIVADGQSSQERVASVVGDFWTITGARAAHGRLVGEGEERSMVISHGLFMRRFGGNSSVAGKVVTINGHAFTITGVLEQGFRFAFPQQFATGDEVRGIDAYITIPRVALNAGLLPARPWEDALVNWGPAPYHLRVVGRVKEGVTMEQARAEMEVVYARAFANYPEYRRIFTRFHFETLKERLVGEARPALTMLAAGAGFVLLIACANMANLLLARASFRQREMAIRAAMGAGRGRVIRQILTEGMLLAGLGGAAGLALAAWAVPFLARAAPESVPRLAEASIGAPVFGFAFVVSAITGLVFGFSPAAAAWRADLHGKMTAAQDGRLRGLLVAAQLALAIVLLSGAALMLRSFWRMNTHTPGFEPDRIAVMRVPLSGPGYTAWMPKGAYLRQAIERAGTIPGVRAVGIECGSLNTTLRVGAEPVFASVRAVSPGYLRAMGAPLIEGRWPGEDELFGVLVNESFAKGVRDRAGLVGLQVSGSLLNDRILGVVADFRYRKLDAPAGPEVYMLYERFPLVRSARVVVRTEGDPALVLPALRKTISAIDATQPVYEVQTLDQALADSIAPRKLNLMLLSVFAGTALLMAVVGTYGVISYSVQRRNREIGVRMASGATRSVVVRMVVAEGMRMAALGIGVGLGAALGLARLMASLLYDLAATDAGAFAAAVLLLAGSALAASAIPAARAARVDPLVALRHE